MKTKVPMTKLPQLSIEPWEVNQRLIRDPFSMHFVTGIVWLSPNKASEANFCTIANFV